MFKTNYVILIIIVVVLFAARYYVFSQPKLAEGETIKIGIITDLTGPAAYWGESTRIGVLLAIADLKEEGILVEPIFEDYQLDAGKAASAAQKLVNVDNVDALYADFNPGAIATASVLKGKDKLFVYDAAIESPLADSPYTFKTYLDYRAGCAALAKKFKDADISTIGYLKVNLEFGELCLEGLKSVYGDFVIAEGYILGDLDFRTQLTKLKAKDVGAIVNVGFEGDSYNTLRN